jgi:RNA polymerase sigma factor (sigma-70 family)
LTTQAEDREALNRARAGEEAAARGLMERHGGSMVRTARATLGRAGPGEAEDVVQEAWVAALVTDHLPEGDVGAWLRAITVRKSLDALRARARRPEPSERAVAEVDPRAGDEGRRLDVLAVREALDRLPPLDRATLVLADLEGRSMGEVAEVLGSTAVAVRLRASRARRRLAKLLGGGTLP